VIDGEGGKVMATAHFGVATYSIHLSRDFICYYDRQNLPALIVCDGQDGHTLFVCFMDPQSEMRDNEYNPQTKRARMYLPSEMYPWYVDLLRNEKPVHAMVDSDEPTRNRLYTGREPVGEEELAPRATG
jgi:hypothetical protein